MLLKKFGFVIVLSTIVSCGTGSSNGVQSLSESSTETKQDNAYEKELDYNRIANYLNYIQYSTSKIIKSSSKVAIDAERFDILNNIKNENLRNDDLIDAYGNLLNTLANLEMSEHDRDRLTLDIENRRNNAIWQAASSLGNSVIAAGGAGAATGGTGAIAALAGVIVNTGINYVRTQNEISRDSLKEALEINSSEQAVLRAQQTNLFSAQAKAFRNKESDKEIGLIRENPMNLFTNLLVKYDQKSFDEQNQDIFIAELSDYENKTWTLFQPYHEFFVELYSDKYIKSWNACIAKVKDKKDKSEKECIDNADHAALDSAITHYNDLIEISKNSKLNIFTEQNPIIKSSSKKLLQPLLTQGNKYAGMVEIVISELERSVVKENPTELSDSRFLIYTAQLSLGNIENAKDVFSKLERTGTVKKTDRMYYTHHCNIIKDENDFCKNSTEMWNVLDNIGSEKYRKFEDYKCIYIPKESQSKKKANEKNNETEYSLTIIDPENLGAKKYLNYGKKAINTIQAIDSAVTDKVSSLAKKTLDDVTDAPERECVAEIKRIKEKTGKPKKIYFGDDRQVFLSTFYETDKPFFFRGHKKMDSEELEAKVFANQNKFVNKNNVVFDSLDFKF